MRSEVAEQIREGYRQRVQARLERAAQAAPSPEAPAPPNGREMSAQPKDLEEIRRQAREAWRQLRTKEAEAPGEQRHTDRELDGGGRERETATSTHGRDDDLAL